VRKEAAVLNTEVLVVGGGPAGVAAAVSSGRLGAKTLLVERYGFLGGMATAGLVNPFMVSRFPSGELIMSPVFREIVDKLKEVGAASSGKLFGQPHIVFDPEVLKFVLLEHVKEAGVKILFHSLGSGAILKGRKLAGVVLETKSGQVRVFSKVTIDATGDADIAAGSGAPYELGRAKDGLMQPATMNFNIGGVDAGKMPTREEMDRMFLAAKEAGRVAIPREKLLWFETVRPGEVHFNVTRIIGIDGTRVEDLTKAEIEGRRQVEEVFGFLKEEVPGFAASYISSVATQVGIRETRRIVADYVLTEDDVLSGKVFKDGIAKCSYPIDIHDPKGVGTTFKLLEKTYDIPYRCLVPKKVENLLVAGRPISVTHEAFSSTRVMPTCMALGEAAGIAAALSAKKKISPKKVDAGQIREILLKRGANYL